MTADQPLLAPRTIGETENALRALLVQTLRGTDLDYPRWVVLSVVARSPSPVSATGLSSRLAANLRIDDASAIALIDVLRARHLVHDVGDSVAMTPDGTTLFERLDAEIGKLTRQLWAGIEVDDLAAAQRVLATITARADELLVRTSSAREGR
jgi:hypothetical protein